MNSTGNELESNDILDFEDNTVNLDILMNADQEYWTDRLGNKRPTIDYALRMAGFTPAGFDFTTGGILGNGDRNKCVFNQADQTWYSYSGDLPYNVIAGSVPGEGWKVVERNAVTVAREALRRTYLEVGYNLVEGSFEQGGVLNNATDVLLDDGTSKAYSFTGAYPKTVVGGTNPGSGGFTDRSTEVVRKDFINLKDLGAASTLTDAENKTILQAAIAAYDGKAIKILIPSDICYGYKRNDETTWPNFSTLSASPLTRIIIEDYSLGASYVAPGRDGTQKRTWYGTGNETDGQHDGNFEFIRAGWHPGLFLSHDGDRGAMSAEAGTNRRASIITGIKGRACWRFGQGRITDNAASEDELSQFIISANGLPDLGVVGLTTMVVINKNNGCIGFNVGVPRYPLDVMSRVGQPSPNVVSFGTPVGEMMLLLTGETNNFRLLTKPTSGFSLNDSVSALYNVTAGGGIHSLCRNTPGNAVLELKTINKSRKLLVRDDNGTLNIVGSTGGTNDVVISDVDIMTRLVFRPESDSLTDIGTSSRRFNNIWAVGTILTSDGREKTDPLDIDDAVLDAWGDVQFIVYQWLSAIQKKGKDSARWHFGVIAQQVRDAFLAHGLDATAYGLLCYDKWDDLYVKTQTNEGAVITKTRVLQRPVTRTAERIVYENVTFPDGTVGKVAVTEQYQETETTKVFVFNEDGTPHLDAQGEHIFVLETVLENYVEEYDEPADPEYTEVLERPAGDRWGIRESQCLFIEAAFQRRERERDRQMFEIFKTDIIARLTELENNV